MRNGGERTAIPFHRVNRRGSAAYDPDMQRHHLLPCQLLSKHCFEKMLEEIGEERSGFQDFRVNGMMLPANESAALRLGMPLHRGPHPEYNEMVIERVGRVEASWSRDRLRNPERALEDALFRLGLLQKALRKRLLADQQRLKLNRKDPLGSGYDFTELDAMAEELWQAT